MKKRRITRIKAVFFALTLVMSTLMAAGCVSSVPEEEDSSAKTSESTSSGEAADSVSVDPSSITDTINVYTALEDDIIEAYLTSFREQYPNITINITRDSTGTIISKLIAEKDDPVADVVWGTAVTSLLTLDDYDLIQPYDPEGVDRILSQFKDVETPARWVGIDVPETAFLVNKAECERLGVDVPESYADLIKPEYEGRIAMSDPTSSGTGLFIINGMLQMMATEKGDYTAGWEYLDAFDKNVIEYTPSGSKPAKMVAAGEALIGLSMGYRCVTLAQENPECVVVFPSEGSAWDVEANCLIKKSEVKDAAKVFLDWAISDEAMESYQEEYPIIATGGDGSVPEGYNQDPVKNLSDVIDLYEMADYREEFFTEFTEKYLN
ncbi:MAG: extracellular solute-binding protein [Lachnospiraceae bacterium]|nr:extracellular solute-binding protein [Lachnospiraceae bacterium]